MDAFSDSQLVVNPVQRDYLARDMRMTAYLDEVKSMSQKIKSFTIRQIPREENRKADAPANLTSTFDFISDRSIPLQFLSNPSIEIAKPVCPAETDLTWMDEIIAYVQHGSLPTKKLQARQI